MRVEFDPTLVIIRVSSRISFIMKTQTRFPGIKTMDTFTNQENILVKAIVHCKKYSFLFKTILYFVDHIFVFNHSLFFFTQ